MSKNTRLSTGTVNAQAAEHKARYDGFFLKCFVSGGTIPANAEDAEIGILGVIISLDGLGVAGLTYEASPTDGTIHLNGSVYSGLGLVAANGLDLDYARLVSSGDSGGVSTTDERIQYTIGQTSDFDLPIGNATVSTGVAINLGTVPYTASKIGG